MDPGRDSIIYRMTSQRIKTDWLMDFSRKTFDNYRIKSDWRAQILQKLQFVARLIRGRFLGLLAQSCNRFLSTLALWKFIVISLFCEEILSSG